MNQNPYDWTRHTPTPAVVRSDLLADLSRLLRSKKGVVLLGGRGMGKSVLLQQVAEQIRKDDPSICVVRLDGPPSPPTLRGCLKVLGEQLGVANAGRLQIDALFNRYFAAHPEVSSCVLLFDEVDHYATPEHGLSLGCQLFNRLEAVRRSPEGRIGILVSTGLDRDLVRDVLGSVFMSRSYCKNLQPAA